MPSVRTRAHAAPVRLLAVLPFAALAMCRSNRAPDEARPVTPAVIDAGVGGLRDAGPVRGTPDAVAARYVPVPDAGPPIQVLGRASVNRVPLAGVTVEVVGRPVGAQVTGADGVFRFSQPNGATQLIRGTLAGRRTQQEMVRSQADINGLTLDMLPDAEFAQVLSALSVTEDPAAGTLFIHYHLARGVRLASGLGATLSVSGGVRFTLSGDNPVRQDTTPVTSELMLGVVNLPVGDVTVTPVTPPRVTCVPERGPATTRIDARVITSLNFRCR